MSVAACITGELDNELPHCALSSLHGQGLGAERHRGPGRGARKGRNAIADLDSPVMQAAD